MYFIGLLSHILGDSNGPPTADIGSFYARTGTIFQGSKVYTKYGRINRGYNIDDRSLKRAAKIRSFLDNLIDGRVGCIVAPIVPETASSYHADHGCYKDSISC
jgi:hypothetical protein